MPNHPLSPPDPAVEAAAAKLCEPGGPIESTIRAIAGEDLIFAAAVADRLSIHVRSVARRLALAAADAVWPTTRKAVVFEQIAHLLGNTRHGIANRLKLYEKPEKDKP